MPAENDEYLEQLMRLGSYMRIMRSGKADVARVSFSSPFTHIPYRATLTESDTPASESVRFSGDILRHEYVTLKVSLEVAIKARVPVVDFPGDMPVIGEDFLNKAKITHIVRPGALTPEVSKLVMNLSHSFLWIPVFSTREMLENDLNAGSCSITLGFSRFKRELEISGAIEAEKIIFNTKASAEERVESNLISSWQGRVSEILLEICRSDLSGANNCATNLNTRGNRRSTSYFLHEGRTYEYTQGAGLQEHSPQETGRNLRNVGDPESTLDTEDPKKIVEKGFFTILWRLLNAKPTAQRVVAYIVIFGLAVAFAWREVNWAHKESAYQSSNDSCHAALEFQRSTIEKSQAALELSNDS